MATKHNLDCFDQFTIHSTGSKVRQLIGRTRFTEADREDLTGGVRPRPAPAPQALRVPLRNLGGLRGRGVRELFGHDPQASAGRDALAPARGRVARPSHPGRAAQSHGVRRNPPRHPAGQADRPLAAIRPRNFRAGPGHCHRAPAAARPPAGYLPAPDGRPVEGVDRPKGGHVALPPCTGCLGTSASASSGRTCGIIWRDLRQFGRPAGRSTSRGRAA